MNEQRYPRPIGITRKAQEYQANKKQRNDLKQLRALAIQHFLNNQWFITKRVLHPTMTNKSIRKNANDKTKRTSLLVMDLVDFSRFLGLPQVKVEKRITDYLSRQAKRMLKAGNFDALASNSRVAVEGLFFRSLHRLNGMMAWEDDLKASSRAYFNQPGYSMAANAAMGQTSSFMAQFLKLAESFIPKDKDTNPNNPHITINNNNQQAIVNPQGQELLTTANAVMMLDEAKVTYLPLHNKEEHFHHLYEEHILSNPEVPNVTATKYDAQGVSKARSLDMLITHENRREELETGPIQDAIEE